MSNQLQSLSRTSANGAREGDNSCAAWCAARPCHEAREQNNIWCYDVSIKVVHAEGRYSAGVSKA